MKKWLLLAGLSTVTGVVNAPGARVTVFPTNVLAISIDLDMTVTTEDVKE